MTSPAQAEALGLTPEEFERICTTLDRRPTEAELAMYAAMWSEHCSYKSSKVHLKTLPTEGPQVVMGPGESAGIVDVGDGYVAVFKLESHNHPSFVEPVQGAATGVGGIVRDIIAAGARPVAILDPLRFGWPDGDERTERIAAGVVSGISQYGNSIGIPTVGGEVKYDPCYRGNPLVNVMCLGIARHEDIQYAKAEGEGNVAILFGSLTGRDGIGGVSVLASRPFDEEAEAKRPSVQVGDPFTEKIVIEVCVELAKRGFLVGLQDLGGAGLCCATSEMAARGRVGLHVNLDHVPLREDDMEPFEILTSESQERMLAVVRPGDVEEALAIAAEWGVRATVIAEVTSGENLTITRDGVTVADVPAASLADEGPTYNRPLARPDWIDAVRADDPLALPAPTDLTVALRELLKSPNIADQRWAYEQYDSVVQHNTLEGPGGEAAVIRLEGTNRALAMSTDGCGRFGYLDPRVGAMLAVSEAARNVACTGARPWAATNCLNFGNPEHEDVMWQFKEAVAGIGEACIAFDTPITGGNVSFYNQTGDTQIHPTPIIGMLGVLADVDNRVGNTWGTDETVILLGETRAELGGSEWAWVAHRHLGGLPPTVDLRAERALIDLLVDLATQRAVTAAQDLSEGGLGVTLAEMVARSGVGAKIDAGDMRGLAPHVWLFSESSGRAVVATKDAQKVLAAAERMGVPAEVLGRTGYPGLVVDAIGLSL